MKVDEYHMKKDEHNTKRYYCHTKKKHLFNGVTKHECGLMPHGVPILIKSKKKSNYKIN